MSILTLKGNPSGTGTFTVESPSSNNTRTITLPDATTTLVGVDTPQTLTNKTINGGAITLGTTQASTSGTAIDFTGIPSWVKRVTVNFFGVSTTGTSMPVLRLGTSGGVEATGYFGATCSVGAAFGGTTNYSDGIGFANSGWAGTIAFNGRITLETLGANSWSGTLLLGRHDAPSILHGAYGKTLSGVLDRIRVTTQGGTDTFDAGTINIMYEG